MTVNKGVAFSYYHLTLVTENNNAKFIVITILWELFAHFHMVAFRTFVPGVLINICLFDKLLKMILIALNYLVILYNRGGILFDPLIVKNNFRALITEQQSKQNLTRLIEKYWQ